MDKLKNKISIIREKGYTIPQLAYYFSKYLKYICYSLNPDLKELLIKSKITYNKPYRRYKYIISEPIKRTKGINIKCMVEITTNDKSPIVEITLYSIEYGRDYYNKLLIYDIEMNSIDKLFEENKENKIVSKLISSALKRNYEEVAILREK